MTLTATPSPTSQGTSAARKIIHRAFSRKGAARCRKPSAVNQLSRITSDPAAAVARASAGSVRQAVSETAVSKRAQADQAQEVARGENQRVRLGRVEVLLGSRWRIVDVVHGGAYEIADSRAEFQIQIKNPRDHRL